ncbi:MAG: PTS sugar transporter subunit IIA [Spirochaetales bacterium]|uniref:PTS sugar transporter subunit IIA n=1 Tax=Candidatus Thalassospirochaeta sargassi TaxID=3119039 RepID=A0AAJ1MPZ2_9SPIO|nr:PTS sugar transporter subunit IIA [Spirochaetales bacterium]
MGFLELLDKKLIKVPLENFSKNAVLEELINIIDDSGKLRNREQAYQDVLKRELLGSTGLERGIAVPHARTEAVDDMVMAVGIAPGGIDFEALDGEQSSLFFLILAPPHQAGAHIEVLSDIAKVTKSAAICRLLLASADADEVIEIFEED